jgi:hypothetical protein
MIKHFEGLNLLLHGNRLANENDVFFFEASEMESVQIVVSLYE